MSDIDDEDAPEGTCPICGEEDFACRHVALTFVPGDRIAGGAASAAAEEFLNALDEALVESAKDGAARGQGRCRDLCRKAAEFGRRRGEPEDAPSELDAERWELLEEIVDRVPGVEIQDYVAGYGGFCAEDSGRVAWAEDAERVTAALKEAADALLKK